MNAKTIATINILIVLIMWFAAFIFFVSGIFAGMETGDGSVNTFRILFALFILASSFGLLLKKSWARIGAIILSIFFIYDSIFQNTFTYGSGWRVTILIVSPLVLIYFFLPSVRSIISDPVRKNKAPLSVPAKILLGLLCIIVGLSLLFGFVKTA